MADFEKVYRIGFDASKAQRSVEKLTRQIGAFEKKIRRSLGKATQDGGRKAERALEKMGRKGKSATDKIAFGARRAERGLRRVGIASRGVTVSIGALAVKISALIGAAAAMRSITSNFLGWDMAMTKAGAKFSAINAEMRPGTEAFKAYRNELLATTKGLEHSAESVGKAVNFWAKAGKTAEQAKAVLGITADFASANEDMSGSVLELGRAGDMLSDTLGQFRLNAEDIPTLMKNSARAADVMSAASNTANFSAEELFDSFKQAGPVLTAVGSDIEETSALLAVMANAGIKGAMSGTQLKVAISALSAPAAGARNLLADLGVKIKDNEGNFRGLTTIIGELNEATKDMGTGERFEVFAKIIGRRAIPSFINLLAAGQDELDAMTAKLREAGGETERLAKITRESATAQLKRFWNQINVLGFKLIEETQLFGKLATAMESVDFEAVGKWVSEEMVPAFIWLGRTIRTVVWPAIKEISRVLGETLGPIIRTVSGLLKSLGGEGSSLGETLGKLIAVWIEYKLAMMLILGPLSRVAGGLGRLVGGFGDVGVAGGRATKSFGLATKGVLAFQKALVGLQAFIAGWALGTLIWEKFLKDVDEKFYKDKIDKDVRKAQYKDILKDEDLYAPDVKIKAAKAKQEEIEKKWGTGFEELSQYKKAVAIEEQARREIDLRKTQVNVQKYGPAASADELEKQSRQGELYTEFQDDWALMSQTEPIVVSVVPDAGSLDAFSQSVEDYGAEMSVPVRGDYRHSEGFYRKQSEESGWETELLKTQKQIQTEQRVYQDKMIASQGSGRPTVEQKFEIGGPTINVTAPSSDAKEIARVARREIQINQRAQEASLKQAGREVAPSEF